MKKLICFLIILCFSHFIAQAQQKRALLIGINNYEAPINYIPKELNKNIPPNLHGCVNDAIAMQQVITSKFAFSITNTKLLIDTEATNRAILASLDTLLASSKQGDIAFIFYAGHGSEVNNSLSREASKKDQAIVPSDKWRDGVHYIRDKQLSYYFNAFVKKKVKLTVIFDCCHSGSISRGPNPAQKGARFADSEPAYDAMDSSSYPAPERISDDFLIFSAAQHDELAKEEDDYMGFPHGTFTAAFLKALNQQSVDASALSLFTATRAIVKSFGKDQEPIIGGKPLRQAQTLFGIQPGKLTDKTLVPVVDIYQNGRIAFQAGSGIGLLKGSELSLLNGEKDTLYRVKIDTVIGIARAVGTVVKGDAKKIQPGSLFAVTYWAPELKPLLSVYVPKSTLSDADVNKFLAVANQLQDEKVSHMKVVDINLADGKIPDPYLSVFWQNNACYVKVDKQAPVEIKDISVQNILNNRAKKDSTLYIELPVSQTNADKWYTQLSQNQNIRLVDDPSKAKYVLFGKAGLHNIPAYGFRKADFAAKDSLQPMPLVTDCFEITEAEKGTPRNITTFLTDMVQQLYKINRWLNMSVTAENNEQLPYVLKFANRTTNQIITGGKYYLGDAAYWVLTKNKNFKSTKAEQGNRYMYLFTIDQNGKMQLLYPLDTGNDSNRIVIPANINQAKDVIKADPSWDMNVNSEGTDTYFLLLCNEPILDAVKIFTAEPVNSGAVARGAPTNPMSELLDMDEPNGVAARGARFTGTYTLQRISFLATKRN